MGKIVKYCPICAESFREKFSFCPNCAAVLKSKEMNWVSPEITIEKNQNNKEIGEPKSLKKVENEELYKKLKQSNESFKVTLVEDKKKNQSRTFLLGSALLVLGGSVFSLIGSIYNVDLSIDALDDSRIYLANILNVDPTIIEEPLQSKEKNNGGGGSGGDKNPNPVSKGVLASQSEKPLIAPSVSMNKVTKPEIPILMETKGTVKRPLTNNPYGDINSDFDGSSNGSGENGGQGIGNNRGQGTGKGPGGGPGDGPGYGPDSGGPAIASKKTPPEQEEKAPQFKPPVGVTVAMKIISKPRAIYTDAARKNLVSGTVTLRVTFQANGSIGNVVAVSNLPDGLTEQAIAAARNIQFEPAKRNGVAQTVTKQVQYTFTLY